MRPVSLADDLNNGGTAVQVPATGLYAKMDFLNAMPSLPRIRDDANVQFLLFQTGATTSAGTVMIDFDYGYGG